MAEPKPSVRIQELAQEIAAERGFDFKGIASLDNAEAAFIGIMLVATLKYFDEQYEKYAVKDID